VLHQEIFPLLPIDHYAPYARDQMAGPSRARC